MKIRLYDINKTVINMDEIIDVYIEFDKNEYVDEYNSIYIICDYGLSTKSYSYEKMDDAEKDINKIKENYA